MDFKLYMNLPRGEFIKTDVLNPSINKFNAVNLILKFKNNKHNI